jgi:DNA-binding transcriptional regulator LsrR (DeoR family)
MQETFDPKVLGAQIRKLSQIRDWSHEQLALQLGVATTTIRRWMAGETAPDLHNYCLLANLFNVSMEELVSGKATGEPKSTTVHYREKCLITLARPPRDTYEELGLQVARFLFQGSKPEEIMDQLRIPADTYERALWRMCNIVQAVNIDNVPLNAGLAGALKERFGLRICRVADLGSVEPSLKTLVLGALGAKEIIDLSKQSDIRLRVGLAGGFTCGQVVVSLLQAQSLPKLDVIPIAAHSNERVVASDANTLVGILGFFSRGTDLRVHGLPYVSNDRLDREPQNEAYEPTRRMLDIARRVDVALLGLGGGLSHFFYRKAALPPEEDMFCGVTMFDLQRRGCIGDILYTLVTSEGPMDAFRQCCDELICSIGLEGLSRLIQNGSYVLTIVAGLHKLPVTRLALEKRYVNSLIIDTQLAQATLEGRV